MKSLTFMSVGVTTRADVIERLGPPAGAYEGERILTYRLAGDRCSVMATPGWISGADVEPAEGCWEARLSPPGEKPGAVAPPVVASRPREQFHLVLVFDGQGRLARHWLQRVQPGYENLLDEDVAARVVARAKAW